MRATLRRCEGSAGIRKAAAGTFLRGASLEARGERDTKGVHTVTRHSGRSAVVREYSVSQSKNKVKANLSALDAWSWKRQNRAFLPGRARSC